MMSEIGKRTPLEAAEAVSRRGVLSLFASEGTDTGRVTVLSEETPSRARRAKRISGLQNADREEECGHSRTEGNEHRIARGLRRRGKS